MGTENDKEVKDELMKLTERDKRIKEIGDFLSGGIYPTDGIYVYVEINDLLEGKEIEDTLRKFQKIKWITPTTPDPLDLPQSIAHRPNPSKLPQPSQLLL
jgi:hypothetical protein